jgi:hypothetical protein
VKHYVGSFGHGAKVWIAMWLIFSAFCLLGSWWTKGAVPWSLVLWIAPLFAANLWFQVSQRVWYDDALVGTKITGAPAIEIAYADVRSIERSHDWKRALGNAPLDELLIIGHNNAQLRISLRHQNIADLIAMLTVIHDKTGLAVPSLDGFK